MYVPFQKVLMLYNFSLTQPYNYSFIGLFNFGIGGKKRKACARISTAVGFGLALVIFAGIR